MSKRLQENIVAFIILGIFIAAIFAGLSYGPRARLVPVTIATLGAILIVAQILIQNLRPDSLEQIDLLQLLANRGVAKPESGEASSSPSSVSELGAEKRAAIRREIIAFGLLPVLGVLFYVFGPAFAVFFFMAGYFILSGQYSPAKGIALSFLYAAVIYVGFAYVLDVPFGPGMVDLSFGLM